MSSFLWNPFNTLVRDGTAGAKLQQVLEDIKPEAVFFSEQDGHRGGVLIVEVVLTPASRRGYKYPTP